MTCKILTIVGARPQFIKAAAVSRQITASSERISEVIVHTGQHYDSNMSQVFFDELGIPAPKYNLEVSGSLHGAMTGRMLEKIESVMVQEKPDWVLIYGDTNSTLAGAIAASKLHIPIAHVEAGLRSFNMRMPEEINRILSDRVSTLLLCPTETAVRNLAQEGLTHGVHNVGDVMYDVALHYSEHARKKSQILDEIGLTEKSFVLATCHRAENTDDPVRLKSILQALGQIAANMPVYLPLHPRTRKIIDQHNLSAVLGNVMLGDPLSFIDMVRLEQTASLIITDSGGVQKEAYFYQVPCITMRDETEWLETVDLGWNRLVGADSNLIVSAALNANKPTKNETQPYGSGNASSVIIEKLLEYREL